MYEHIFILKIKKRREYSMGSLFFWSQVSCIVCAATRVAASKPTVTYMYSSSSSSSSSSSVCMEHSFKVEFSEPKLEIQHLLVALAWAVVLWPCS